MSESVAKARKGGYEATNVNSLIPRYVISPELRDSAQGLIKFLEEYYSYLHEEGNALYELDRLEKQFDVDETDDKYLTAIQDEIASIIPEVSGIEKKVLYKRIVQFYRAKGTKDAVATFFRIFFPDSSAPDYPLLKYRYDLGGNIIPHEYEIIHGETLPREWRALYKALSHPAGMKMIAILELLAQNSTHAIERGVEDLDSEYDGDLSDPDSPNFIRYDSHVAIVQFIEKYLAVAKYPGRSWVNTTDGSTPQIHLNPEDNDLQIHLPLTEEYHDAIGAFDMSNMEYDSDEYFNEDWIRINTSYFDTAVRMQDQSGNELHGIMLFPLNSEGNIASDDAPLSFETDGTFVFTGTNEGGVEGEYILLPLGLDDSDLSDGNFSADAGDILDAAYAVYGGKTIFKDTDDWSIAFWYKGVEASADAPDHNPPSVPDSDATDFSPLVSATMQSQTPAPRNGYHFGAFGNYNSMIGINDDGAGGKLTWVYNKGNMDYPQAMSTTTINDNKWHHCVIVNTGGSGKGSIDMYVDGVKEVSAFEHDQSTSHPYTTNSYFIANSLMRGDLAFDSDGDGNTNRIPADDPEWSQGSLLDYRVYSRALTSREVNNIIAPHSNHAVETSLILNATSTEDNIFNERFSLRGRNVVNWNDQRQSFFQQYGFSAPFPSVPHEPYSSRQRSYSVRKAYNSTLKYKDSTPISVYKKTPIGVVDGFHNGLHEFIDDVGWGKSWGGNEFQHINVGANIVRKISGQYIPFTLGLDSDSDIYNIAFSDSDSFSDYNIPATRLAAIAGDAVFQPDVEIDVDTELPEIKRIEGYGINVAESTEVQDDGGGGGNQVNFELPFSWKKLTSLESFFDYTDYGRIDFDLVIDATWAKYIGTINGGRLQTNIENWFVKVNDVILNNASHRDADDTRITYRFTWLNPRAGFFKEGTNAIPTDRYCNLRTADAAIFGGDGKTAYGRNPIIGSQAFFSGDDKQDKTFKLVLIDRDDATNTKQVGWPNISREDTNEDFSVNLRVDYQYKNTRNNVIDRYFGRKMAGIHDISESEVPAVQKITAAYGTEVMDIISHVSNDSRVDTDYQVGTRNHIQIAKDLVLFDETDSITKQYLQEEDGITGLVPDTLGEAQTAEGSTVEAPRPRNRVIWGAHTYQNNLSNAQAGSYMDMPWQDMANYLGFKVEFDANARKPGFDFELHFAGIWGEYWHEDGDANAHMWVNHVPGEDEYAVDGEPNLQNYNHTPITNAHHTDCWPFSYKMRQSGITELDGANYRMVNRNDGGMDLFIVGKIHQFWRDGAHPHLMMPGLSIAPKDQTLEVWKFKNYNPRQLTLNLQCPDDRVYLGAGSREPFLGVLRGTPISNNKIGSEYGTLSSLAKCDARAKDRSGIFYPERGPNTEYGQNLTQVYHDLDLYGYTTGALNYGHTKGRISELPSIDPWTTDNPWSGSAIGDQVLPGRGLSIDPRYIDKDNGNYPTADLDKDNDHLQNVWISPQHLIAHTQNSIPRSNLVVTDRIRSSAHILSITKGVGSNHTWPTDETRIKYGWSGSGIATKENPYDLDLYKHGADGNGNFNYFTNVNDRLREDKNVSRKRNLESGNGIPLSEWYRQHKVTPAHFHVSRIQSVDQKIGLQTLTDQEEKFYLVKSNITDGRLLTGSTFSGQRQKNAFGETRVQYGHYVSATLVALNHILNGAEVYPGGKYVQYVTTYEDAINQINAIFGNKPEILLNETQKARIGVRLEYGYYTGGAGNGYPIFDSKHFTVKRVNNVDQGEFQTLVADEADPNILVRPRETFSQIGSLLQGFEKSGGISLTDTADCTHANLYCRWHLKYKNNAGEEGIFFQIPWNMTKNNTSFSNYLLQIENQKYNGDVVNRDGNKTINTAINYFSEFVTDKKKTPGAEPDNIPASGLVRDMFRLKGENRSDAGKGDFTEDKQSLGYYYPSSKAALRHLGEANLDHRTDKNTVTSDTDPFKLSDRMPRMTGTVNGAPDDQSQPELISFVDYAPINNYETTLDKFTTMVRDLHVVHFDRAISWEYAWMHAKYVMGGELACFPDADTNDAEMMAFQRLYFSHYDSFLSGTRNTVWMGLSEYKNTPIAKDPKQFIADHSGANSSLNNNLIRSIPAGHGTAITSGYFTEATRHRHGSWVWWNNPTMGLKGNNKVGFRWVDGNPNNYRGDEYVVHIGRYGRSLGLNDAHSTNTHGFAGTGYILRKPAEIKLGAFSVEADGGGVTIYQYPSKENNYVAVIRFDSDGGDRGNRLIWRLKQTATIGDITETRTVASNYSVEGIHQAQIIAVRVAVLDAPAGGFQSKTWASDFMLTGADNPGANDNINHHYYHESNDLTRKYPEAYLAQPGWGGPSGVFYRTFKLDDIRRVLPQANVSQLNNYALNDGTLLARPPGYIGFLTKEKFDEEFPNGYSATLDQQIVIGQYLTEGDHSMRGIVGFYNPFAYGYQSIINGYPALVPNGIVPPNHNKLLGLPHILNHPDPTNLILPTQ